CEVPAATVQNAKVVVDQAEACRREAGDIIQTQKLGSVRIHAEIGEIAAGNKAGRESETEITFFKSVGNAVQDLAVANQALLNAEKLGLGQQLSL
ncbi:MAG: ornithine cyclodeaminase family protein, partial [bacterium]